jgi:hypothetical protein
MKIIQAPHDPGLGPEGCRRLWAAVLKSTLDDLALKAPSTKVEREQAHELAFGTDEQAVRWRTWVCHAAGVEPGAFQDAARRALQHAAKVRKRPEARAGTTGAS